MPLITKLPVPSGLFSTYKTVSGILFPLASKIVLLILKPPSVIVKPSAEKTKLLSSTAATILSAFVVKVANAALTDQSIETGLIKIL